MYLVFYQLLIGVVGFKKPKAILDKSFFKQ